MAGKIGRLGGFLRGMGGKFVWWHRVALGQMFAGAQVERVARCHPALVCAFRGWDDKGGETHASPIFALFGWIQRYRTGTVKPKSLAIIGTPTGPSTGSAKCHHSLLRNSNPAFCMVHWRMRKR